MKIVKEDWDFKVSYFGGEAHYFARYIVEAEGVTQSRDLPITLTQQEETQIKNFIMDVVRPKVEAHESGN